MKKAAEILSAIFIPLLAPTYLSVIILVFLPGLSPFKTLPAMVTAVACAAFFSCLPPFLVVYFLFKKGIISSLTLEKRSDRRIPQIAGCVNFVVFTGLLGIYFGFNYVFTVFMLATTILTICIALITRYWKISTHAAGMFGMVTMLVILKRFEPINGYDYLFFTYLVMAVLVCLSRLYLKVHTVMQLIAGSALAMTITALTFWCFS